MYSDRSISVLIPLIVSIALAVGIYTGVWIQEKETGGMEWVVDEEKGDSVQIPGSHQDLDRILRHIQHKYVDSVDRGELMEKAVRKLLSDLDPHSNYIPQKQEKRVNEPLEGSFEGIGVQFMIQKDTVVVVSPIPGGPSESLGILPGDRIVEVEGEDIAGVGIENKDVVERLRGEKGSEVGIKVYRPNEDSLLPFEITRGEIPIKSVDVGYMVDQSTGYVKVSRFAQSTPEEFREASGGLMDQGMERLILDLRSNGGGYLPSAIEIADEFLPDGSLIVYTEGRSHPKKTYDATAKGFLHGVEVAVLLDEGSASASEIVAGAIQDHDRGIIVGRRSFGKGLVQEQLDLSGMGSIRLTVARFHTPSGRCIQKPYGEGVDYEKELFERYESGELLHADSIDLPDSLKFQTLNTGRTVYGGGGIVPDLFVPIDTQEVAPNYSDLIYKVNLNGIAFDFADQHRESLTQRFESPEAFIEDYQIPNEFLARILREGEEKGVDLREGEKERVKEELRVRVKALIGRNIWNDKGYYPILLEDDRVFQQALEALNKGVDDFLRPEKDEEKLP